MANNNEIMKYEENENIENDMNIMKRETGWDEEDWQYINMKSSLMKKKGQWLKLKKLMRKWKLMAKLWRDNVSREISRRERKCLSREREMEKDQKTVWNELYSSLWIMEK